MHIILGQLSANLLIIYQYCIMVNRGICDDDAAHFGIKVNIPVYMLYPVYWFLITLLIWSSSSLVHFSFIILNKTLYKSSALALEYCVYCVKRGTGKNCLYLNTFEFGTFWSCKKIHYIQNHMNLWSKNLIPRRFQIRIPSTFDFYIVWLMSDLGDTFTSYRRTFCYCHT